MYLTSHRSVYWCMYLIRPIIHSTKESRKKCRSRLHTRINRELETSIASIILHAYSVNRPISKSERQSDNQFDVLSQNENIETTVIFSYTKEVRNKGSRILRKKNPNELYNQ